MTLWALKNGTLLNVINDINSVVLQLTITITKTPFS